MSCITSQYPGIHDIGLPAIMMLCCRPVQLFRVEGVAPLRAVQPAQVTRVRLALRSVRDLRLKCQNQMIVPRVILVRVRGALEDPSNKAG